MEMVIPGAQRQPYTWRLNEDLIQDLDEEEKIKEELEHYFKINYTKKVTGATLWEAQKAYIRGILMAIGLRGGEGKKDGSINKGNP